VRDARDTPAAPVRRAVSDPTPALLAKQRCDALARSESTGLRFAAAGTMLCCTWRRRCRPTRWREGAAARSRHGTRAVEAS